MTSGASREVSTVVFGMGCFWAPQEAFESIPGVESARVGYASVEPQSSTEAPSYFSVCQGNGYTEAVEVTFNGYDTNGTLTAINGGGPVGVVSVLKAHRLFDVPALPRAALHRLSRVSMHVSDGEGAWNEASFKVAGVVRAVSLGVT